VKTILAVKGNTLNTTNVAESELTKFHKNGNKVKKKKKPKQIMYSR